MNLLIMGILGAIIFSTALLLEFLLHFETVSFAEVTLLFGLALSALAISEGSSIMRNTRQINKDKNLNYYTKLLEEGTLSEDEFKTIKSKILKISKKKKGS